MAPKSKKPGGGKPGGDGNPGKSVADAQDATATAGQQGRPSGGSQPSKEPGPTPATPSAPARPDFENPKFDDRKLTEYALNPDHPVGGNKARVIKSATGLGPDDAPAVKQQILDQARQGGEPIPGKVDEHGSRWAKDVTLTGPNGTITVRTAWIVDAKTGETRLVTVSFP